MDRGFHRVRPLEGGLDAWVEAGREVEEGEWDELLVAVREPSA